MLSRLFTIATLTMLCATGAQAGTLQNGAWAPNCPAPGEAPSFSSKTPEAYNASAKKAQEWQEAAKTYVDCLNSDAKADQNAVVTGANDRVKAISDQINALSAGSAEAVEKLKKKKS